MCHVSLKPDSDFIINQSSYRQFNYKPNSQKAFEGVKVLVHLRTVSDKRHAMISGPLPQIPH